MTIEEFKEKQNEEAGDIVQQFMEKLDVDEDVAVVLVEEGFTTLEEVAYVPLEEMAGIEGFDAEIAEALRARAKDALLTFALASEEELSNAEPAEDLLNMEGMDLTLAHKLAAHGVVSMEDLAEQSIDDLLEIENLDPDRAAQLILTARAPWFEEEAQ